MANTINLVTKFVPILDEIYKKESVTSLLDAANNRVEFVGANEIKLFTIEMQGLGDYSRSTGYVSGDITAEWETLTLTQDRGRSFQVDVMDNEETLGMVLANLSREFIRTQVAPEIDAYRFANYAANAGTTVFASLSAAADVISAIDAADTAMSNAEVPHEGRILFVSESVYALLKEGITRYIQNDEQNVNRTIEVFDNMRVVRVPSARFNTSITLASDGAGGYTAGGNAINFMIVHPSAVVQVVKHVVPRLFSPAQNLDADAWKYNYRIYHDCFVETNKENGIYLHAVAGGDD